MNKPHVVVIGADKGGVGKTTVSRVLLSYFLAKGKECRAFDTEVPGGVLKRFYPGLTEIVDLTNSDGQMQVFDTLAKSPITVIDVRAGLLTPVLAALSDIGMLEAVQNGSISLTVLHILGASAASFKEIEQMAAILAGAKHYLVINHINDASFFDWSADARRALEKGTGTIQIPKLDVLAAEHIEQDGVGFTAFVESETNSMVLRGHTRNWLGKVYKAFDQALTF
jgi:hypothetical protein